jgi:fibronectin type 3 domain-containing protein
MTTEEAVRMESVMGTYMEGVDYNVIVDGHGTGLAPPTAAQYSEMVGNVQVTDSVQTGLMSQSSYDLSAQPYFPAVGNQLSQGSCAAWAMAYYDYGYLEARDNNWTDASTGNPAHLMSPAWTYNRVNYGIDRGTFMDNVADIIKDWGVASLATMPYNPTDLTSWGNESAAREAPLHRAAGLSYISYSSSNPSSALTTIKNLISANSPVTFAIDANVFTSSLTDNIITANEYNSKTMNHAQTIVGYDDAKSDGVHSDVGAFKVVNSWGKNWGNGGYYWISYEAMKKIGSNLYLTYITDKPSYRPSLLAIIEFNNLPSRESSITVGVGSVGSADKFVPYFEKNYDASVTATFPSFLALDMTDLLAKYKPTNNGFYLTLGSTTTPGIVSSFRIEQYQNGYAKAATQVSGQSLDVPKANPGSVTVTMTPYASIAPETALDNAGLTISGSGNAQWSPVTRDYHSNGSAMQSGNIGNGARSIIQTIALGPSTISFWWKTSTANTDVARFYVDSVNRANASGVTAWSQVSLAIASGTHILRWEYVKDASVAGNQDLVLLDQVVATSGSTVPSAPTGLSATVGSSIQLNWSAPSSNGGSAISSYGIYRGTSAGGETLLTSVSASSLTYTDSAATVDQDFFYQVTAVNSIGESPSSNEVRAKIPASVPSAPSALNIMAGASYIDLTWSSNEVGLAGFHLYRGTASNGETLLQTLSSTARSYRDSAVVAGTIYYYRMDAFNDLISSSYGNEVSIRIPVIPDPPTGLTSTVTGSSVHLNWTAPHDDGGSAILGYKVYRGTVSGGEAASPIGTFSSTSYDDLTTTPGIRYYYVVRSFNAVGSSVIGNEATVRVPTVPSPPASLNAVVSGSYIHLSWTLPIENGGATIDRYAIYRGTFPGAESPTAIGSSGTTSYDDASAVVGVQYYYVVRAHNQVGESASSNEASSRIVLAPDAPSSLTVSVTLGHISLSWTAPSSNGGSPVTSYRMFRGATADPAMHVQIGTASTTSYDDTQIIVGQTYYYSVKAANIVGSSVYSNVVSALAKGLPSAPAALTAQISDRSVLLSWSAPTSIGFSTIAGYKVYRSGTSGTETLIATATGMTYNDNGLVNGMVYYYRVSAVNAMGEGPLSPEFHDSPATIPDAPKMADTAFSIGTMELTWSVSESGGRPIIGFSVYRGSSSDFSSASPVAQSITDPVYLDSSVAVGSTYYYFVTATNAMGTSMPGLSGPIVISSSPSAPRSVTAVVVSDRIQLSWTAPASVGSSPISGYYVYRSLVSGQGMAIEHLGNTLAYSDHALTLGQTYHYSVSAENQDGSGPLSSEVTTAFMFAPDPPSDLMATGSIGAAWLTWSVPAVNGGPLSGYTVYMRTSDGSAITRQVGSSSPSALISGLTNGVQYWFTVTATNSAGEGSSSSQASCVIGSVPSTPTALSASAGNGSISISWEKPASDGGLSDLSYQLWRSTSGESTLIATLGSSARTYADTSVVIGTTYRYVMTASNSIGTGIQSGQVSATAAIVPGPPSEVSVESDSSSITVTWAIPEDDGGIPLSGFSIHRSSGAVWTMIMTINSPTVTMYRDQSIMDGVLYQYRIAGINGVGEGFRSWPSSPISTMSIPSAFSMNALVGDSNITLFWDIPASIGAPLSGFDILRTESQSGSVTLTAVSSTTIRFVDDKVIPGCDYVYRITAINALGSTSTDQTKVHSLRNVTLEMSVVPFQNSVSVSGTVSDLAGNGIGGQKVTIYRSASMTGDWSILAQLNTTASGKFSSLITGGAGIFGLRAVLSDDGTHSPITIEQAVGSLRLKNGGMANIISNSAVSDATLNADNMLTFTLEQAGTANITIPKDSVSDLDLIGVTIDGQQRNYEVTETDDQYIFHVSDIKAGQIISMSIGRPSAEDNLPLLVIFVLMIGALGIFVIVRGNMRKGHR